MSDHKTYHNKIRRQEITQNMYSEHKGIKSEINPKNLNDSQIFGNGIHFPNNPSYKDQTGKKSK